MKLTKTQKAYLRIIGERHTLKRGWGGYGSTLTVRLLEEKGLVNLQTWPRAGRSDDWQVQLTHKGRAVLDELTDCTCPSFGTDDPLAAALQSGLKEQDPELEWVAADCPLHGGA